MKIIKNEIFLYIKGINGISRPFWAFFLTYCYFLIPFTTINSLNSFSIFLGFITMFFFFLGHFSLNAIFDQDVDRSNPRKNDFNSWNDSLNFRLSWIMIMIAFFWIISLSGAYLHHFLFSSSFAVIFIMTAIIFAVVYSVPPFQFKGRAPLDLFLNQLSFGIIGPLFVIEILGLINSIPLEWLTIIFTFCISTLTIVVVPTIMMDTTVDKEYGYNTFSVRYGLQYSVKIIEFSFIIQLIMIIILSIYALYEKNYLFLAMMFALVIGESCLIIILKRKPSERNAELVASFFTFFFIISGIYLLLIAHLIPIISKLLSNIIG